MSGTGKLRGKFTKLNVVLSILLFIGITFSIIQIVRAVDPDPGHIWSEIDDVPLPVTQGGTASTTLTGLLKGAGTNSVQTAVPGTDYEVGYGVETVSVFSANGTWTKLSYVNNVYVEVWGAGGGGLTANANNSMGGGGGGGYSAGVVSVSGNVSVVVGGGGAQNANGTASSFPGGATLTGDGGVRPTTITGGAGGTATGGTINLSGLKGGNGSAQDGSASGPGGGSPMGGAGGAGRGGSNAANQNGANFNADAGLIPGGGGGGGAENNGTGAAGANGLVIVWALSGTNGSDLAEMYETKPDVEAGDVVAISADSIEYESEWGLQKISVLEKATLASRVVGVVSTAPAVMMGRTIEATAQNPQPIALAGRTLVKVSLENGLIKAGDILGPSSIPGVAAKMEKVGMVIGATLEDYKPPDDGSIGKVMILVQTGYSSGARLKSVLEKHGINIDEIPKGIDIGRLILAQMMSEKKNITKETEFSEIFTDRLVAGLEIISPRVLTDILVVNAIEPVDKNITFKIAEGGKLIFIRAGPDQMSMTFGTGPLLASSTPVLTIDDLGNAIFSGAIKVDSLTVGSTDRPNGITLYDTATGEPYCVKIYQRALVHTSGECSVIPNTP